MSKVELKHMHDDEVADIGNLTVRVYYKALNLEHQMKDFFYN